MNRFIVLLAALFALVSFIAAPAVAAPKSTHCSRFIVGQANSTAYPNRQLPARGTEVRSSCATLRRIARRLQSGKYRVPSKAFALPPAWGSPSPVRDNGRRWMCEFQNRGASGPTYGARCTSGSSQLNWSVG
jgi:hypothetical protein